MFDLRTSVTGVPSAEKIIKQVLYGTAVGLTKTAKEAQAAVIGASQGAFRNRKPWMNPSSPIGIKITPATAASQFAEVYAKNYFLPKQDEGGIKLPFSGTHVAVPAPDGPVNTARVIPAAMRPRALIASGRGFIITLKSGVKAVAVRGLKKRGKFKGLTIAYFLVPKVKITATHVFYDPIQKVIDRRMMSNISREVGIAIAKMR